MDESVDVMDDIGDILTSFLYSLLVKNSNFSLYYVAGGYII